jgi:hypothetical protein
VIPNGRESERSQTVNGRRTVSRPVWG